MIFQQVLRAIGVAARLFIRGDRDNDIARRDEVLALQANQRFDQRGVAILHVDGAATVEPAILFGELKRIHGPVGGHRLDDVEMAQNKSGLALPFCRDSAR